MSNISELVIKYLQLDNSPNFNNYTNFLREVCRIHPPPHGMAWYGDIYRQFACQPEWFSKSLIVNADREGFSSREIYKFSRLIEDREIAELVCSHSIDESRHSKIFISILDLLFPTKIEADFRAKLKALSPGYTKHERSSIDLTPSEQIMEQRLVVDALIQINLIEIRALILLFLLRPLLQAYASTVRCSKKLARISESLIGDEINHIKYSAYCIEKHINSGNREWVREIMIDRQAAVNQFCLEDLELEGILL